MKIWQISFVNLSFLVTNHLEARHINACTSKKAVERLDKKSINSSSIEETANSERPVPFYNWLNERDSFIGWNGLFCKTTSKREF
ncbi:MULTISPECIES: hypothetical protein [unclassified Lysinibacillus]|uniref:hypothetical protein n=1 Tax=unclassified Lysinibacillus TaxID=2636778 RepID=UPI0035DC8BBF